MERIIERTLNRRLRRRLKLAGIGIGIGITIIAGLGILGSCSYALYQAGQYDVRTSHDWKVAENFRERTKNRLGQTLCLYIGVYDNHVWQPNSKGSCKDGYESMSTSYGMGSAIST